LNNITTTLTSSICWIGSLFSQGVPPSVLSTYHFSSRLPQPLFGSQLRIVRIIISKITSTTLHISVHKQSVIHMFSSHKHQLTLMTKDIGMCIKCWYCRKLKIELKKWWNRPTFSSRKLYYKSSTINALDCCLYTWLNIF